MVSNNFEIVREVIKNQILGTMEVVNQKTGLRAVLTFKPAGWASKDLHRVEGFIVDKK